jgi:hypothetical protein
LHYDRNDASLQKLVANWHQLTLAVRQKIIELLPGKG